MSTQSHPISFYQHLDITDPTLYEEDDEILCGEECMLCGMEFRRGDTVMEPRHESLSHDRFLFHKRCLERKNIMSAALDVFDEFGFEVDELEEE